jgi:uncharacterized protein (UPF0276 family)
VTHAPGLAAWIESRPPGLGCVELVAERFYKSGRERLQALGRDYPLLMRGSSLSLGTAGPLHPEPLGWFASLVRRVRPLWISEHLGFQRTDEVDLAYPTPVPLTGEMLTRFVEHCREVVDRCGCPLLVENLVAQVRMPGTMSEPEFLNRLCAEADCRLLVDVTAVAVNARIHGFDPHAWIDAIDARWVTQLHVGAYARDGERWDDAHADRVPPDVWRLAARLMRSAPVAAVVLQRDASFPPPAELRDEIRRIVALCGRRVRRAG